MSLFDPMPIAISIAVTLACLLVTSRLAAAKGRSGPAWFGWTLVFGPLATIALIVLPRRASKDDEAL